MGPLAGECGDDAQDPLGELTHLPGQPARERRREGAQADPHGQGGSACSALGLRMEFSHPAVISVSNVDHPGRVDGDAERQVERGVGGDPLARVPGP
jgi:hypothetical protein